METFAIHKNAMVAPLKARMTIDLIRGKKATTALDILKNTNTKSARLIEKVLKATVILSIPSKILGFVVGIIEGYIWSYTPQ